VNAAILAWQAQDKEAKLALLLKMMFWVQGRLAALQPSIPQVSSLVTPF
jgi:hypothetical protein